MDPSDPAAKIEAQHLAPPDWTTARLQPVDAGTITEVPHRAGAGMTAETLRAAGSAECTGTLRSDDSAALTEAIRRHNPAAMTEAARRDEVAAILARGYLRLCRERRRFADVPPAISRPGPFEGRDELAAIPTKACVPPFEDSAEKNAGSP